MNALDQVNGDLKIGDYFVITAWCGNRAYIRPASPVPGFGGFELCGDDYSGDAKPNTVGLNTILCRLDAVDRPSCILTMFAAGAGSETRVALLISEFEQRKVSAEYVAAYLRPVKCSCPSCNPPSKRGWLKRLLKNSAL